MNEGPDRALLPGEADPGRAARVPSQRRCKSDRVLTFGELEQFIKANPSKKGTKRKLDVEPKSDSDSDNSSDAESVRIVF